MKLSDQILPIVNTVKQIIQEKIVNGTLLQQVSTNIKEYIDKHPPISNTEQAVITQKVSEDIELVKKNFLEEVKCTFGLFAFVLSRLPNKLSKFVSSAVILSVLLSACQAEAKTPAIISNNPSTISADLSTNSSTDLESKNTITVEPTATVTVKATETIQATEKAAKVDTVEQMAITYVDGQMEIDFDSLSNEEYEKLSVAITEELNDRIESPLYFSENGQTTYADENTGKLETIRNSEFEQRKKELAPDAYIPAKKDDDGTWMYLDEETKQYVRIEGSAGFNFYDVVDENNMDSDIIKWPTTPKTGELSYYRGSHPELTEARILLKDPAYEAYIPVILASKQIFEIPVQHSKDGSLQAEKALKVLVKEAYGFKEIYVVAPASRVSIQEENNPKDGAIGLDDETDGGKAQIKRLLIENQIYFLGVYKDQAKGLTSWAKMNINNVRGVVSAKDSFSNLTGDTNQSKDKLLVILASMLIRHKQVP